MPALVAPTSPRQPAFAGRGHCRCACRLEVYAQSFGMPIKLADLDARRQVARDLINRSTPPRSVRV